MGDSPLGALNVQAVADPPPEPARPGLEVQNLSKSFGPKGEVRVLRDLSFAVARGEFVSLLGPSGCGKTTTLNLVAGFLAADAGEILIGGQPITHVPTHKRDIALVFQNYSLFPHMTVGQNVSFGLRMRRKGMSRDAIRERVDEMLGLVQLPGMMDRYPHELSGGQQQRVGLARALAVNPGILLLDEPLSNLDAKLRKTMQIELRQIIEAVGTTTLYVTHDQEEALSMSDRVIVMNHGRIEQSGVPDEVYGRPETEFVANFVGESNMLPVSFVNQAGDRVAVRLPSGLVVDVVHHGRLDPRDDLLLVVRPDRVRVERLEADGSSSDELTGTISVRSYIGSYVRFEIDTGADGSVAATLPEADSRHLQIGDRVRLRMDPSDCLVIRR